ncbi:hypothetical protein H2200_001089 [Cladophialophora chaetospira]|uniref:SNF2 N-terminal domain-containing protein n=1 Tax=Cladophialophora chaetospira TaxID=386627 RepID=A0AA38XKH0_9EURO|nr:hypothetical protein H2200_001089 [Cladophialophora chaetospira]
MLQAGKDPQYTHMLTGFFEGVTALRKYGRITDRRVRKRYISYRNGFAADLLSQARRDTLSAIYIVVSEKVLFDFQYCLSTHVATERLFDNVVVNEGHVLKNPNTKLFKVIKSLKAQFLWIVTGTPMANSAKDLAGLLAMLYRPEWEQKLNGSEKALCDKGALDVFAEDASPHVKRLRLHPKFLRTALANKDNVAVRKYALAAMELCYIRRTAGSEIPNGDEAPLRFEERLKASVKCTGNGKIKFNYPNEIYRRLCLLTFSLLVERLAYLLEQQGTSTSAQNILRNGSADPPIDFR